MEVFAYIDDSGSLHPNYPTKYFVYAGYIFTSKKERDRALATYRSAEKRIQGVSGEKKACKLKKTQKRYLVSVMRDYQAFACVVDIRRVYERILSNARSIHRYKDYCLKRMLRTKLEELMATGGIDTDARSAILTLQIDNQPTSTDGFYTLNESIREEFGVGVWNFDYGVMHPPVFKNRLFVNTHFCDSSRNYLVRACDLLANMVYHKANFHSEMPIPNDHLKVIMLPDSDGYGKI